LKPTDEDLNPITLKNVAEIWCVMDLMNIFLIGLIIGKFEITGVGSIDIGKYVSKEMGACVLFGINVIDWVLFNTEFYFSPRDMEIN